MKKIRRPGPFTDLFREKHFLVEQISNGKLVGFSIPDIDTVSRRRARRLARWLRKCADYMEYRLAVVANRN